jgi:hypothetical protein
MRYERTVAYTNVHRNNTKLGKPNRKAFSSVSRDLGKGLKIKYKKKKRKEKKRLFPRIAYAKLRVLFHHGPPSMERHIAFMAACPLPAPL